MCDFFVGIGHLMYRRSMFCADSCKSRIPAGRRWCLLGRAKSTTGCNSSSVAESRFMTPKGRVYSRRPLKTDDKAKAFTGV